MASTVDQSLLSQLKQKSRDCDIVTAAFENGVPSRYNVFIINVGAKFYFKDSDTQTVGPYSVRVGSGGDYPVLSACRDCCVQIFGAMNVLHEPTGQVKDIKEFRKPSEPGQCLLVERFRLVIQRDATEDELSAARKSSDWSGPLLALEAF